MHSASETVRIIAAHTRPLGAERCPLEQALGRILAEPVVAPEDLPAFDRSAMDGYAVGRDDASEWFQVVGEIRAGQKVSLSLGQGQAVRVSTGAALPGANLQVVIQEDAVVEGGRVRFPRRSPDPHIRFRGEDTRRGSLLLSPGTRLGPGELSLLASVGWTQPTVRRLPRVLHGVTGDELVRPDQAPPPGMIRDSNSTLIRGLLREWGVEVWQTMLPEDLESLWERFPRDRLAQADLVLVSGGASVGRHDATRRLLERLGFDIHVAKVNARPGKPLLFASLGDRLAFGLPGNPVAHWVCYHLFVAAALRALMGLKPELLFTEARLEVPLADCLSDREAFWCGHASLCEGQVWIRPRRWRSSGDATALAGVNSLMVVPPATSALPEGSAVKFLPVGTIPLRDPSPLPTTDP